MNSSDATKRLCLACGLCCNGVLFSDVELQREDDPPRLTALGLQASMSRGARGPCRISQPCAALCPDNFCRVYAERPARCREFECGVFKELISGKLEMDAALRLVRQARQRAGRVLALLRALDNTGEDLPLSVRFRRARRRFEAGATGAEEAELFGELTLAVHQLNVLTHARFYTREPSIPADAGRTQKR